MPLSGSVGRFNPGAFNRIVITAVGAGVLAGLLLTVVQKVQVSGLILQAEVYEDAAAAAAAAVPAPLAAPVPLHGQPGHDHAIHHLPAAAAEPEHEHSHEGWQPENGAERTFYTVLANISMGVSFGLLLASAFSLRGEVNGWRAGLLWGAAGYAAFFLAPAIGLPPELPGTVAAPLAERQLWWSATAACSAGGLALLAFARVWPLKLVGVVLLAAPQLVGAPQPLQHGAAAPAELVRAFIVASAAANAVFWLALGALAGFFYKKFA